MLELIHLLFLTVLLRPYVFIFLAVYLLAAFSQIGFARTAVFTLLGYSIAFLSEYSSTRIGFPYGFYSYIQTTKGQELWVSNVPFMDSLSYSFLAYCSLSLAIFLNRPIERKKNNIQINNFEKGILQKNTLFYATLLFVLLDVIIDPVALRGSRWFLGQIYHYHDHGLYFGVPLSNFAGWIIVGFCIIYSFQFINKRFFLKSSSKTINMPYKDLLGPVLYFSVMLFNIFIAFHIDEYLIGSCGLLITGSIFMLFIKKIFQGNKEENSVSDIRH